MNLKQFLKVTPKGGGRAVVVPATYRKFRQKPKCLHNFPNMQRVRNAMQRGRRQSENAKPDV